MFNTGMTSRDWYLWLGWIFATAVGLMVSDFLGVFFFQGGFIEFLLPGVIIGSLQGRLILQHQGIRASRWIAISTIGWTMGWILGLGAGALVNALILLATGDIETNPVVNAGSGFLGFAGLLVIHGTVIGITQWYFVLRKKFYGAGWWVFANIVGWSLDNGICWGIIAPVGLIFGIALPGLADSDIRGTAFGAITGFTLVWLLRQSRPGTQIVTAEASAPSK